MSELRLCARCGAALLQRLKEPTLDFRRRRTCGSDTCRWQGEPAPPRLHGEWPAWMMLHKPFAAFDREPGDCGIVRLPGPEPRLGGGSSAASLLDA